MSPTVRTDLRGAMAGAADQTRMREKLSPLAEHKSHNEDTQEARELVCCGACRTRGLRELRRVRVSAGSLPGLCHAHAVRAHTITTHHVGPSAGINKPPLMCVGFRVIGLSCAANQIAMNPELTALLSITRGLPMRTVERDVRVTRSSVLPSCNNN